MTFWEYLLALVSAVVLTLGILFWLLQQNALCVYTDEQPRRRLCVVEVERPR